ncbi:ankyrin repeat-containing domain protein [Tuber indicum]|nr:ankyrin repeat-containing domain protein [Tuber indicum]
MSLLSLPNELLLLVGESLEDVWDVNSFVRVNHRLHSLLTPHLHTLALRPHKCPVLPLCWAAWKDHAPLVDLLLSSGALPETPDPENGDTALHYALYQRLHNNPISPILKTLLAHTNNPNTPNATDGSTLLHRAAAANALEELTLLLSTPNIDVDARIRGGGDTPLARAVSMNHPAAVKALLRHGADPNVLTDTGYSPLSLAVRRENREMVSDLLLHSADPTVHLPLDGQTVLHQAAGENSQSMVRLLLRHGVFADIRDRQGRTPLDVAVLLGCGGAAGVLLEEGANVGAWSGAADGDGETTLFKAVRHCPGRVPLITLLVRYGADFRSVASSAEGKSALEYARDSEYSWVVEIFENFEKGIGKGRLGKL